MTESYATVRDLPDGGKEGICTLCGQHLTDGSKTDYIEPLTDAAAVLAFRLRHDLTWAAQP